MYIISGCSRNRCDQGSFGSTRNNTTLVNAIHIPLINESIVIIVSKDSCQRNFTVVANRGIVCSDNDTDAIVDIDRIFGAEYSAAVGIRYLNGEDVGVGAIRKSCIGQTVTLRIEGHARHAGGDVAVGHHPLVAQATQYRVVAVDVRMQLDI